MKILFLIEEAKNIVKFRQKCSETPPFDFRRPRLIVTSGNQEEISYNTVCILAR